MRYLLVLMAIVLTGCGTTLTPVTPPQIVEQEQIKIDPRLYEKCSLPDKITSMDQAKLLNHSKNEALKLINCYQKHDAIGQLLCQALHCDQNQTE